MNRRSFLKALTAVVGATTIPVALVEACQTDAPIPKDWTVGIIDREGTVLAQANVASLDYGLNLCVERTGIAASIFFEGGGLPGRVVGPIQMPTKWICTGGTVHMPSLNLSPEFRGDGRLYGRRPLE